MKKLNLVIASVLMTCSAWAQFDFMPNATQATFSVGSVPAVEVTIYETTVDYIEKEWKNILKQLNGKVNGKGKEFIADNVNYPELSNTPVDMYYSFTQQDNNVRMVLAVDLGTGMLSAGTDPNKFNIVKGMLHKFSKSQTQASVKNLVKIESKKLEEDENALEKLVREKEKLEKEIEENIENQGKQKQLISKQKEKVALIEKKSKSIN
jgi:hypothetical protein